MYCKGSFVNARKGFDGLRHPTGPTTRGLREGWAQGRPGQPNIDPPEPQGRPRSASPRSHSSRPSTHRSWKSPSRPWSASITSAVMIASAVPSPDRDMPAGPSVKAVTDPACPPVVSPRIRVTCPSWGDNRDFPLSRAGYPCLSLFDRSETMRSVAWLAISSARSGEIPAFLKALRQWSPRLAMLWINEYARLVKGVAQTAGEVLPHHNRVARRREGWWELDQITLNCLAKGGIDPLKAFYDAAIHRSSLQGAPQPRAAPRPAAHIDAAAARSELGQRREPPAVRSHQYTATSSVSKKRSSERVEAIAFLVSARALG